MLEWTGERYIPWMEVGEVHYNHLHRYLFAAQYCKNKRVLDLGCGEGYGSNILSKYANEVVGVDIDESTIAHARAKYDDSKIKFIQGSVLEVPLGDHEFDIVVSFEVLEHIEEHDTYIAEIKRLLKPNGVFFVSTPNKLVYTDPNAINPFHKKELNWDEFVGLMSMNFSSCKYLGQRSYTGSNIWSISEETNQTCDELYIQRKHNEYSLAGRDTKIPIIFIAVAANSHLPEDLDHTYKWLLDTSNSLIQGLNQQINNLHNTINAKEDELNKLRTQLGEKLALINEKTRQLSGYQNSMIVKLLNWYLNSLNKVLPPGTYFRNWHDMAYQHFVGSLQHRTGSKTKLADINVIRSQKPKCLGILLCYNDADILPDVIDHLVFNHHDLIAWNHGSDDDTATILEKYKKAFKEIKYIPRSFDFYQLYPAMSKNIIEKYVKEYDWISWPDQDEILEGPARDKSFYEYLCDVYQSKYNYIRFNNFNYWFTCEDDPLIQSPVKRIKRYSIFLDCAPRIRSWRSAVTNIRDFNHNVLDGEQYPILFNLRHYPMRSFEQMNRRLDKDRINLQRGNQNYHYDILKENRDRMLLRPDQLHFDDGKSALNICEKFHWPDIYGNKTK